MPLKAKRVVVAMSGGVDSSVAAALLKNEGYEVIGVTMNLIPDSKEKEFEGCCSFDSILDAKKVAHKLNIPHYVLNLREEFKRKVIKDFCFQYLAGKTPNPCIMCNRYLKFNALLKKSKGLNADFIATGHYARVLYDKKIGKYLLKKGIDSSKDQSYVLYMLNQKQLKKILFPVGNFTKLEIRELARKFKLPVAEKKESQEICFIPDNNYPLYIKKHSGVNIDRGSIFDEKGNVLGSHEGIVNFTIGQRRGLGISFKEPLYVTRIDPLKNKVIVGKKPDVFSNALIAEKVNIISGGPLVKYSKLKAKIRYKGKEAACIIRKGKNGVTVIFKSPQWAITPGQSVVFYKNDTVIGGGIIKEKLFTKAGK